MVNSSNLYADKILQQHPLALWTLDSDAKYLSLITDAQRNLSTNWTFSSSFLGTTTTELDPKLGTTVSLLYKDGVSSGTFFTATSDFTFNSNSDSFTIGAYVSKASPYITQIAIGYDIGGTVTYSTPTITITESMYNYQYVSATFNTTVTGAKVVLRFNYSAPAAADRVSVMVNGLTVGKWAEDFNVEDLGSQKSTIPTTIAIPKTSGILASQYNTAFNQPTGTYTDKQGYYIVQGDVAYARNTGHPMVYGCTNSTKIYPYTANEPSLILPGYGFLNEVDKYKTKTYEMWLKINSSTLSMKRIMGPISGNDGLYVDVANLILKVGTNFISYYIGEWDRPMLVQIVTSQSSAEMFINGDSVGNLKYDIKDILLSEYYYPTTLDNKIINSNFENHSVGWGTRNGTSARTTGDSFIGSASILYTVGSTGTTGGINTVTAPTTVAITAVTPSSPSVGYVKYTGNNIYSVGDTVTTSNLAPAGYNGTFTVTEVTDTYFVVANATTTTVTDGIGSSTSTNTKLIPISPGNTYTYSIYMKDVNTGKQYNNVIDYYNSSLGLISGSSSIGPATTISSSDWTRVTYTFTVPETVGTIPTVPAYARPYTYSSTAFAGGDSGNIVYYDGALFQQSALANPYVYKTPASNIEQDWIGFYAHSDVSLEVSCVAVYNYAITKATALSRWSYGQAVSFPKEVVSAYSGSYIVPDYTVSKYANNQNYGVMQGNTWKSGKINNFVIDKDTLSLPTYSLPTIEFKTATTKEEQQTLQTNMFTALSSINATYIDLQPDSTWTGVESHILFDTLNPTINDVNMFYVVFDKSENNTDNKQIIFQIIDKSTGNYLEASILNNTLGYYFYYNSTTPSTVATFTASSLNTKYAAAINIPNLIASNSNFTNFFSNKQNLKVYVGGAIDFSTDQTFTGKIYKVGFGDSRNYDKVSLSFNSGGYYAAVAVGVLDAHIASYTLLVQNPWSGQSFMDIAVNSYWQDAVPLSRLSKTVDGQYRLDYLQFNIDYPNQINTTDADVKTYLTFQTIASGMNADITTFANTTIVGTDRYINVTPTYSNRKYQVIDGTVVYIPTDVESSTLAVVAHVEINNPGIILNPTKIRSLQIAAQAIGSTTTIGTKGDELISFGTGNNPILISKFNDPYYYLTSQSGFRVVGTNASTRGYYSNINKDKYDDFSIGSIQFSAKFPLTQFAEVTETITAVSPSTPSAGSVRYTANNNFSVGDTVVVSGLAPSGYNGTFTITARTATNFTVANSTTDAVTDAIGSVVPEILMFELENVDDSTKVKFYVIGETSALTRGRIYAKDQSGANYTDLKYYLNGVEVDRAIVSVDEWFMLGIKFTTDYSLNSKAGKFNFSGKQLINHFEYFQPNSSQRNSPIYIYPKWINVKYSGTASETWNTYASLTWQDVATSPSTSVFVGTNVSDIQEVFSGTGKKIIGKDYSYPYLIPQSQEYRVFMSISSTIVNAIPL
jgi:hypothetical protein